MTFTWNGYQINYSEGTVNYARKYIEFKNIMKQKEEVFDNNYSSNNPAEINHRILKEISDFYIDDLIKKGYYDINFEQFSRSICHNYAYYTDANYENYLSERNSINEQEANEINYRTIRKASRGKVIGGGFGMSGAIKGMAKAGAINATTGIAHGIANAFGNAASRSRASRARSNLKSGMRIYFWEALDLDACEIFGTYIKILSSKFGQVYSYPSEQTKESVDIIIHNIAEGKIPEEQITSSIATSLSKDPYNETIYEVALEKYGDKTFELQKLSDFFGCEIQLEKLPIIESIYKEWKKDKCYEGSKWALNEIKQVSDYYGIELSLYKNIYEEINNHMTKCCTYNDVVYDSPRIAERAPHDLKKLKEISNNLDDSNTESIKQAIQAIESSVIIPEREQYISKYQWMIDNFDEYQRTVDEKCYNSLEEAQKAKEEKLIFDNIWNQLTNEYSSILKIIYELEKTPSQHYDKSFVLKKAYLKLLDLYSVQTDNLTDDEIYNEKKLINNDFSQFYHTVDGITHNDTAVANKARQEIFYFSSTIANNKITNYTEATATFALLSNFKVDIIDREKHIDNSIINISKILVNNKNYKDAILFIESTADKNKTQKFIKQVSNHVLKCNHDVKEALHNKPLKTKNIILSAIIIMAIAKLLGNLIPFLETFLLLCAILLIILMFWGNHLSKKQNRFAVELIKMGYIFEK